MTDYNALKVPDLKALLGQRKLLQTGNKQALITRLQEDDEKNASGAAEEKPDAKEDEITYSDDEAAASKPAAEESAPAAAASKPEEAAKPEETAAPAEDKAEAIEPAAPAQSYTMGLEATAVEAEAKKRAERAKRFGIDEDDEAKQRAERAKRFGLDQGELATGLDSALPERPLKRGHVRGSDGDGNRPGKRQSLDRRGRHGRGPRQGGNNRERGGGVLSDAAEKAKAEKRAARFAAAS